MHLVIQEHPTNVSFYYVQMKEAPDPLIVAEGYFKANFKHPEETLKHRPNPRWIQLNAQNSWFDTAALWGCAPDLTNTRPPRWTTGRLVWRIPMMWIAGRSGINRTSVPERTQTMRIIRADGTSTVDKLQQHVQRTPAPWPAQ